MKTTFAWSEQIGQKVAHKRGLVVRPLENGLILSPTLIITEAQCEAVLETMRRYLSN